MHCIFSNILFALKYDNQRPFDNLFQMYQTCFLLNLININIFIVCVHTTLQNTMSAICRLKINSVFFFAVSAFLAFFKHSVGM